MVDYVTAICTEALGSFLIHDAHLGNKYVSFNLINPKDADRLLSPSIQKILSSKALKAIPSPDHYQKKTLIVNSIRKSITDKGEARLTNSINADNSVNVERIHVVNKDYGTSLYRSLKITFATEEEALKILENGPTINKVAINPEYIKRDKFTPVIQCFKCFSFDHFTKDCISKVKSCIVCSLPVTATHNFKNCTNKNKPTCINCQGPHIAIFQGCPKRKEIINAINNSHPILDSLDIPTPPHINNNRQLLSLPQDPPQLPPKSVWASPDPTRPQSLSSSSQPPLPLPSNPRPSGSLTNSQFSPEDPILTQLKTIREKIVWKTASLFFNFMANGYNPLQRCQEVNEFLKLNNVRPVDLDQIVSNSQFFPEDSILTQFETTIREKIAWA